MTELNPILKALDDIDENIAAEAVGSTKKKMKKPLKIILIAAAAASLALVVGFASGAVGGGDHKLNFGVGDSVNRSFYFNLTSQEFTIPEEFTSQLTEGLYRGDVDTPLSELFRMFGITPLMNENFTDPDGRKTKVRILDDGMMPRTVDFTYCLHDKNLDKDIWFKASYVSDIENFSSEGTYHFDDDAKPDLITLNDGSLCLVTNKMAVFSYNGVRFELIIEDTDVPSSADIVKQVLKDLKVYN